MTTTDWLVIAGAALLIAAVNWWFFIAASTGTPREPRDREAVHRE